MKFAAILFLLAMLLPLGSAPAQTFPDAPYMSATIVHNSPSSLSFEQPKPVRTFDWQFIATHATYGASLAVDLAMTKIGVGHGCEEANGALGPYPGTGRIVGYGIAEFAAVTTLDYGLKRLGQHLEAPRWMQDTMGMLGASIGTFKHARGAMAWTRTNCL